MSRLRLILIVAMMPEEAFGWFIRWCLTGFPDGLGGFQPASRKAIEELRKEAAKYLPDNT